MYPIVRKEKLADKIYLMDVMKHRVWRSACLPGQFIIVKMDEEGERIPLTICDYDREKGTVTIVFQTVGCFHNAYGGISKQGDSFMDFVGPLGHAHLSFAKRRFRRNQKEEDTCLSRVASEQLRYIRR